ncbi:MAG TPA: anthranilate phosphoribosyltransferase [Acidimicrobiales bacterium]|nr:anthranilate phosphoribosyltransferase [Acidimicrobiales bacterium]
MNGVSDSSRFVGWPAVLAQLFRREDLSSTLASATFEAILSGESKPTQIAAFVAALKTKGETVDEITGFVEAMRRAGEHVDLEVDAIDTCGTGGDRSTTINVSTSAAFVAVGAGAVVAKHGGRAASSKSGSADVLEALGVAIELGPDGVKQCIESVGIGFCFAPRFHPAMRFVAPVRGELGVPTIFNVLGPLANPAGVTRQVVGVGDPAMAEKMLGVLEAFGSHHAIVCYGNDGLDELSTVTTSTIFESSLSPDGARERRSYQLDPQSLGLAPAMLSDLQGGNPAHNAERLRAILSGAAGPQRDIVLLNAAAALVVADIAKDIAAGLALAEESIDSGAALAALDRLISLSRELGGSEPRV